MKLSKKLMMVSVAALMGVSPIVANGAVNNNVVSAASKSKVNKTYGHKSRVTATKTIHFVNANGKKTSKKAYKNGKYTIWLVKKINGRLYYGIQTNGKYWIAAKNTKGSVSYVSAGKTVTITTNGKSVKVKEAKKHASKKHTTKKHVAKKSTKKVSKKINSKKKTKKIQSTKLVTIRKTHVYDKNGKKAKTYMGSKKWTVIGKKVNLNGHGSKTIKGVKYYALQPNRFYIKASDVKAK